jgi:hypothetical protein
MYTPPAGNAVAFDFTESYTPPGGNDVELNFAEEGVSSTAGRMFLLFT